MKGGDFFGYLAGRSGELESRVPGPDPDTARSYSNYASFSDPDGNLWLLQEITKRLPGRTWEADPADVAARVLSARQRCPWLRAVFVVGARVPGPLDWKEGLEGEPTWSPDGRLIAYSSDQSGNFDIWVRPVGEGKPIQVTTSPAHDWQPAWSPDGVSLVFRSERDGGGIFVAPALGGSERKLSSVGYHPRWSPDGSQILFFSAASTNT